MLISLTRAGADPSACALRISARSMASVATAGRSIAWNTWTRWRSRMDGTPDRSGPTMAMVPSYPSRSILRSACQQSIRGTIPNRSTEETHSSKGMWVSGRFQSTLPVKWMRRSMRGRLSKSSWTAEGFPRFTGETVAIPSPPAELIRRASLSSSSGRFPARTTLAPERASATAEASIRGVSPTRGLCTETSATFPTRSGYRERAACEGRTPGGCS